MKKTRPPPPMNGGVGPEWFESKNYMFRKMAINVRTCGNQYICQNKITF